ncbi:MAG: 50S ribosomal protein L18 [Clostridia bacterium]|nr:50S ribosomal protein L18 [Clostridia bacterium]
MVSKEDKKQKRNIRRKSVRRKVSGTSERPRLCVFRSLKHIAVQIIDDEQGITLVSANTMDKSLEKVLAGKTKSEKAFEIGKAVADRAKAKGITKVVFDRAGYLYTGAVQKVADGAREAGLEF